MIQRKPLTLLHLIRLFKTPHCTGKEMNALVELITACINYKENNAVDMRSYLVASAQFESIWRLYFDPLLIETVNSCDERDRKSAIGQEAYLSKQSLTVRWTDGREDVCSDGVVHPRERVDNLVHQALNACTNKETINGFTQ